MRPLLASRRAPSSPLRLTLAAVAAGPALLASAAALAQSVVVVPSFTLTETATDNRELTAIDKRSDLVTQVSPGVSITAKRGALQGSLAYSLNGYVYSQDSSKNNVYHSLSSSGKLSLLEGRFGVDALANAGRQVISAFATQSAGAVAGGGNQAQVVSYSLAPYLKGRLLGDVAYQARVAYSQSISDAPGGNGDSRSLNSSLGLSRRVGPLGWGVDFSRLISESQLRPRGHNGRITGSLLYFPDIELKLALRAGTEVDDLRSGRSERTVTWGGGLTWTPGPRTNVSLDLDHRFFGRSHAISLSHRMARTTWTLTDARSLDTSGVSSRGSLSNYDFFFQQLSSIADPALRDTTVRQLLTASNLDPSGRELAAGFLTLGPTVQRSQNASMTYQGLRTTLTLLAFQTWSTSTSQTQGAGGALSSGNTVHQRGLSISLAHRLTTDASLVVAASEQKTAGSGPFSGNDLRTITATWSARLGPYTNVSLGVRHAVADSDINPYQESAVIGSIRMQF
jgi:uncharacterized protein (PEP-CTERM system associated)